jgi:hypothetical protein
VNDTCGVVELCKEREVQKLPAPIKLDSIKAKIDRGLNITLVVVDVVRPPRWHALVLVAPAVVAYTMASVRREKKCAW